MVRNELGHEPPGAEADYTVLPVGARIGRFQITAVLGQGGFGITYRARDDQLDRDVAIKEYLPASLAVRQDGVTVLPRSTKVSEDFTRGRTRFVAEGRTLASLQDAPGIVRVFDFLELNGTAYIVMELVRGETLEARLARQRRLGAAEVDDLLWPLLDGLQQVHAAGFLHRDIKPANILLREDGRPTLIDFGASRAAMADRATPMTAIFTPGYAAAEQMTAAKQGPWTDIYGLSATLYHAIVGVAPPSAIERILDDSWTPLAKLAPAGLSPSLLAGLDAGLAVRAVERPQSIAAWRRLLARSHAGSDEPTRRAGPPATVRSLHGVAPDPTPAASLASAAASVAGPARAVGVPAASASPVPLAVAPAGGRLAAYAGIAVAVLLLAGGGYMLMRPAAPSVSGPTPVASSQKLEDMKVEDLERVLAERRAAEAAAAEKRRAEDEAKLKADTDAAVKRAADAELAKAEAARQKAEAELATLKAELEARRLAEETQTRKAEAEAAQRKAEADAAALREAEAEARRKAAIEAEAKRLADAALAQAQAERLKADEEARQKVADAEREKARATAAQIAEAESKAKADEEAERKAAEVAEAALRMTVADRQRLQVALTALGFDTRGSDGAFGPRSREMIAAWQRARNQPVTGFLTAPQRDALLREAAAALQKYDDDQKKKEDDDRKKAEEARRKPGTAPVESAPNPAIVPPGRRLDIRWTSTSSGCRIRPPSWSAESGSRTITFYDTLLGKIGVLPLARDGSFQGSFSDNVVSGTAPGSIRLRKSDCDFVGVVAG